MSNVLVIRNGLIVDGTGKMAFHGDIAINGNLISEIGQSQVKPIEKSKPTATTSHLASSIYTLTLTRKLAGTQPSLLYRGTA